MQSVGEPQITFALIGYNQERFITEAVQGALNQTFSPLEIVLSDDCSSDRTFSIMQTMAATYRGPHKIVLNRNEKNLGFIKHINRVMEIVQGDLIVIAAGDDISKPSRTEKIFRKFVESHGNALSIFSSQWDLIDEFGNFLENKTYRTNRDDKLDYIYFGKRARFVPGHSHAWHRSIFDLFGPINADVLSEDIVIPFRAALIGKVQSIDEALVIRRYHSSNIGGPRASRKFRSKLNWYKEHHRSQIMNRIGIARTFLADIEKARYLKQNANVQLDDLTESNKKYLNINLLELEYFNANIFNRLFVVGKAVIKYRVPISRIGLWVLGYYSSPILTSFPINHLYLLFRTYIKQKQQ